MTALHRLLIRLLPRARRQQFGDEMTRVFDEQRRAVARESGVAGVGVLWMKEATGIVRFSVRELLARLRARIGSTRGAPRPGGRFSNELRWAWRGVRARGWRAGLVVGLLALALAANTVLFSIADSLVFRRVPYRDAERLARFSVAESAERTSDWSVSPEQLGALRDRRDLFESVHGYLSGRSTFVIGKDASSQESTAFVTPGLVEMLGARPRWGRSLSDADALNRETRVTLVSESLARESFGDPASALGQRLETSEDPLVIVGVMPQTFAFPNGRERIWRPLDDRNTTTSMACIVRLASGVSTAAAGTAIEDFARRLTTQRQLPPDSRINAVPIQSAVINAGERRLIFMLLGAALCLLLIACANVASVELAHAAVRARVYAIQLTMGASRGRLLFAALLEGAWLVGGAVLAAALLSWGLLDAVKDWLPERTLSGSTNPVHLDIRSLLYMAAVAAVAWVAAAMPVAWSASRSTVLDVLKREGRTAAGSRRATVIRRILTTAQTAIAVCLLVGGALYLRTYASLLGVDKGFDSSNVVEIGFGLPTSTFSVPGAFGVLNTQVADRLRARSDVKAFTRIYSSPFDTGTTSERHFEVDGGPPLAESVFLAKREIDAGFFDTLQPVFQRGRKLDPGDPAENVLVGSTLAARLWPGIDPIGHQFRISPKDPWLNVAGVISHIRFTSETPLRPGARSYYEGIAEVYSMRQPPRPPVPAATTGTTAGSASAQPPPPAAAPPAVPVPRPNVPRSGASYMFLTYAARLDPRASMSDLYRDIRGIDNRFRLTIAPVDQDYANAFADKQLAARIVTTFGALAGVIAIAGLYGVMAFVVASRTRELGIRVALGAATRDISRLILASSLRLVLAGIVAGLAAAAALSQWLRSEFYGVSPIDPLTYLLVPIAITIASLIATWQPARQATRVDPATTLRAE